MQNDINDILVKQAGNNLVFKRRKRGKLKAYYVRHVTGGPKLDFSNLRKAERFAEEAI